MTPAQRRWAVAAATLGGLLAAACLALLAWLPSDDELARRVEAEFEARLGQKLEVGAVHWRVFGGAMVEVRDARTLQPEPIRVRRLAVYPELMPLLRRQVVIDRLEVDGADVPRSALAAYRGREQDSKGSFLLRSVAFNDVTYTSYSGVPVVYAGEIQFDDDRLPQRLLIRRPDVEQTTSLEATRDGKTDEGGARSYQLQLQAAGGSAEGQARLSSTPEGRMNLTGELTPRHVEVEALLKAFNRRSPISGFASGKTELRAEGDTYTELFRSLHTRSVLQVERAKILRFNMEKAVKSLGEDRTGETALESLKGVVDTQNTEQGMKTEFTQVRAVSGPYTAYGRATLYRRQIDAEGKVETGGGVVEVPFTVKGPTRRPEFGIAWGAIAGAVAGTAVLPGIGTVLGAKIGGALSAPAKPQAEPQAP
jgi:hypothetical protein